MLVCDQQRFSPCSIIIHQASSPQASSVSLGLIWQWSLILKPGQMRLMTSWWLYRSFPNLSFPFLPLSPYCGLWFISLLNHLFYRFLQDGCWVSNLPMGATLQCGPKTPLVQNLLKDLKVWSSRALQQVCKGANDTDVQFKAPESLHGALLHVESEEHFNASLKHL